MQHEMLIFFILEPKYFIQNLITLGNRILTRGLKAWNALRVVYLLRMYLSLQILTRAIFSTIITIIYAILAAYTLLGTAIQPRKPLLRNKVSVAVILVI